MEMDYERSSMTAGLWLEPIMGMGSMKMIAPPLAFISP